MHTYTIDNTAEAVKTLRLYFWESVRSSQHGEIWLCFFCLRKWAWLASLWSSYYYGYMGVGSASNSNHELMRIPAVYEWFSSLSFIWCLPEANFVTIQACNCQTHSIDLSKSCRVCCKRIQLESSSLPLSFTLTLESDSNRSLSVSRLS